jgi:hypothetical protein
MPDIQRPTRAALSWALVAVAALLLVAGVIWF